MAHTHANPLYIPPPNPCNTHLCIRSGVCKADKRAVSKQIMKSPKKQGGRSVSQGRNPLSTTTTITRTDPGHLPHTR